MVPLGFIFGTMGYVGLHGQSAIILDAIKGRNDIFVRSFKFTEMRRHDFPVVSRVRKGGIGDVILSQDGHWDYDIEFPDAPWFQTNAVGFLSVPNAKQVMEKIDRVVSS